MDTKRLQKLAGLQEQRINDKSAAGLAAVLDSIYQLSRGNKGKLERAIRPNWGSWSSQERENVADFLNDLADSLLHED